MCPKNREWQSVREFRRNNKQIKRLELGNGDVGSRYVRQMVFEGNFGMQPKWRSSSIGRRTRSGNHPEEDLAKSGYKLNMKHKVLILLSIFLAKLVELNVGIIVFFWGTISSFPFFVFQPKNWENAGTFFFLVEIRLIVLFFWGGGFLISKD
jgi:hypothetical protein